MSKKLFHRRLLAYDVHVVYNIDQDQNGRTREDTVE